MLRGDKDCVKRTDNEREVSERTEKFKVSTVKGLLYQEGKGSVKG